MKNTLEKIKSDAAEKAVVNLQTVHTSEREQKSLIRLGAVGAIGQLAQTLSAQTIRALQTVRDDKDFEALGFTRFDDFLDESDVSPMSYRQFYDREKLLEKEGDHLFDLMNSLKLTHRQRRLLGAGHVQIDDKKGTVIIVTGEDLEEETEEIELTDRTRLLQTLSALADQAAMLNVKTTKQRVQIQKGEEQVEDLKKKLDDAKNRPGATTSYQMLMAASIAIDAFAVCVKGISDQQKNEESQLYLNTIRACVARLEHAYGRKTIGEMNETEIEKHVAKRMKNMSGNTPDDNKLAEVTASLSDEELADLIE